MEPKKSPTARTDALSAVLESLDAAARRRFESIYYGITLDADAIEAAKGDRGAFWQLVDAERSARFRELEAQIDWGLEQMAKPRLWGPTAGALHTKAWPIAKIKATGNLILPELGRMFVAGDDNNRGRFYRRVPYNQRELIVAEAETFARDIDAALRLSSFAPIKQETHVLRYLALPQLIEDDNQVALRDGCVILRAFCGLHDVGR